MAGLLAGVAGLASGVALLPALALLEGTPLAGLGLGLAATVGLVDLVLLPVDVLGPLGLELAHLSLEPVHQLALAVRLLVELLPWPRNSPGLGM